MPAVANLPCAVREKKKLPNTIITVSNIYYVTHASSTMSSIVFLLFPLHRLRDIEIK